MESLQCLSLSSAPFPAHNRDDLSLQKSPTKSLMEFLDHRPQLKFCLSIESLAYGQIFDLGQYAGHSKRHPKIIELGWVCGQQLTACPTTALLEVKEISTTAANLRKLTIHSATNPNVGNVGLILEEDEKVAALESLALTRYNWNHTADQIHAHWDLSRLRELKLMDMNHCAFLSTVSLYDLAGLQYLYIGNDQSSNEGQNHAMFKLLETAKALKHIILRCKVSGLTLERFSRHSRLKRLTLLRKSRVDSNPTNEPDFGFSIPQVKSVFSSCPGLVKIEARLVVAGLQEIQEIPGLLEALPSFARVRLIVDVGLFNGNDGEHLEVGEWLCREMKYRLISDRRDLYRDGSGDTVFWFGADVPSLEILGGYTGGCSAFRINQMIYR